jgi:ribosomal protein L1
MDEEVFNLEIRKFLKKFGITAQREIERAVRRGIEAGTLSGSETLRVHVKLEIDGVAPAVLVEGTIGLS